MMNNMDYYALKAIDNLANMISLTQDLIIKDLDSVPYLEANIDYYTDVISKLTEVALRVRREWENDEEISLEELKNYKVVFHDAEDVAD